MTLYKQLHVEIKKRHVTYIPGFKLEKFSLAETDYIKQHANKYYTDYQRCRPLDEKFLTRREFQIQWLLRHGAGSLEVALAYNMKQKSANKAIERIWAKMDDLNISWLDQHFINCLRH